MSNGTHACDYLLTTDMEMEPVPGYKMANWELGYGDFHLIPDMTTLRRASWLKRTALVICSLHNSQSHKYTPEAPRSVLQKQLDQLLSMGYES